MNINELDAFNLADAVKFHDRLNPRLWDDREHLRPDVHAKLLEIAEDFKEFLGIDDLQVRDITISGSNAAFNYTAHSDIDLHIVADLPEADTSEVFRELFDAKKYQYNDQNDIRIGGYDVELYVQNPNQPHYSQGIYSLLQNKWLSVPKRRKAEVKDISVKSKYEDIGHRIESAIESGDEHQMNDAWAKLKNMRQQGLEQQGEFSPENLAFKILRNNGTIQKLKAARQELKNKSLSLPEARKPVVYGFVTESPDGVNPSTKQILETEHQYADQVQEFIRNTADQLDIENIPKVELHDDPDWSIDNHSFGMYEPESHVLHVNLHNRHLLDILRTVAHELAHCRQHEIESLSPSAGETGSRFENEAHAVAGIIMRNYADANPEMFGKSTMHENASGYIPKNKKEARDPRYSMAVSVDIKPGQVGKEANKLALNTGRNGEPGLLMKSANLRESRMPQPSQGQGKYRDLNAPLGPEFKPTMPKGTVRVDVSDVYDWYKLGKHIPNLDRADASEFGKGPPSTIVSFGDEDTEHKYIDHLQKLGLDTTDIDPVDPDQPPGMKRQKTDPTYNVNEQDDLVESLRQELALLEDEFIGEIKMSPTNLRAEAAKTGALAGMEFEMIVPNIKDDDGGDLEPDYDQDERVRDIDDCVNFFDDNEYNSSGMIRRLRDAMYEEFWEWRGESIDNDWWNSGQGFEYFKEYLDREDPFDEEEAEEEARNELQAQYGDELDVEEFEKMLFALVDEKRESYVQDQWDEQGGNFDAAREEYSEDRSDDYSEQDWLEDRGIRYASDVESNYSGDITWPYYTSTSSGEGDIDQVADDFSQMIGKPVNASSSYHGARREPGTYVVEPDGSLDPDDSDDMGLEFVSPPMPIDEMLSDLNKVKDWAGRTGCYTNDSTGLHINISVPDYSLQKLDFVKLALLLGDQYVLDAFGRSSNTYAKSALGIVKDAVRKNPEVAGNLLDKMKGNLDSLASKAIHSGITSKYTSINTKNGYIEFRSPGGDWLDENFDKVENTLMRFTVAMSAAMNPDAYREEYLKKLYKLLTQDQKDSDTIKYFSEYVAGKIPRAALRSFVKQAQLERKVKRGQTNDQKMWWKVSNPAQSYASIEVVASNKQEAIDRALQPDGYPSWANTRDTVVAEPLRPYEEQKGKYWWKVKYNGRTAEVVAVTANDAKVHAASKLGIAIGINTMDQMEVEKLRPYTDEQSTQQGTTVAGRPNNPDGNWYLKNADTDEIFYRFNAANYQDAHTVLQQWKQENPDSNINAVYGQGRDEPAQAAGQQRTGINYEIYRGDDRDDIVAAFVAVDDQAAQERLERYRRDHPNGLYGAQRAPVPGSTIDLQRQRAAQAQEIPEVPLDIEIAPPRSPAGNQFTGEWKVLLPDGREVYRFSGVGNSQADANRVAAQWLRNNGMGVSGEGFEVLPVMGAA
jgi:hypothetical protein